MDQRREDIADHMRERMDRMQDRSHDLRERHERALTLSHDIREQLKNGNPHPAELKKQLEELQSMREDRRRDQRMSLQRRWGRGIRSPEVKDELERHARRLARLQRLEVVAATERAGDGRKKLIARIEALRTQEDKRHEEAMKKLVPDAPPAADASTAPGGSATPPAAPAASGGVQ